MRERERRRSEGEEVWLMVGETGQVQDPVPVLSYYS